MPGNKKEEGKEPDRVGNYLRTEMQKDMIIRKLREQGCRITKQRMILLDVILGEECACCKEIYYRASQMDYRIGPATVYRMVNKLEQIGAISRRHFYQIVRGDCGCVVELSDHTVCRLSQEKWKDVVKSGLRTCGYIENQDIIEINITEK